MVVLALTLLLLYVSSESFGHGIKNYITTDNGGQWGNWGILERCPNGTKVKGVSLKVEGRQYAGDDTAVNGIYLHCYDNDNANEAIIHSTVAQWGHVGDKVKCKKGHVEAYQTQVEPPRDLNDDTALNNIKVKCSSGELLEPKGSPWGSYGSFSNSCQLGVCGIKTRVESPQGAGDDTALNDLIMICCDY